MVIVGSGGGGGPPPPAIPPPIANGPLPLELRKEMARERTVREREIELYGPNGLEKRKNIPRADLKLPKAECDIADLSKLLKLVERRPAEFTSTSKDSGESASASGQMFSANKALRYSPSPYSSTEAVDGRHPILFNAGNETLSYTLETENVCGFEQLRSYRDIYEDFFVGEKAALKGRRVLVLGDSVLRNQIIGAVAAACNPFLMFNCSMRYFHMFNLVGDDSEGSSAYGFSADFPNGPVQCYLNGTEMSDHSPGVGEPSNADPTHNGGGGGVVSDVGNDSSSHFLASTPPPVPTAKASYRLPRRVDPKTSPIANMCGKRLAVRHVIIEGLTHTKHSFTRAERRQNWHKAYPPPLLEITFVESNTTFIFVDVHCHRSSHIGAFMSNLARVKRRWPARWEGHIDMVIANGGLHCSKKLLVPFYRGIPEGIEVLRQVTNGHDGRPTELIYYESPTAFLVRPPTHNQVDGRDITNLGHVVHEVVRQAKAHLFPTRAFTPDTHEPICVYNDPLHPSAACVASIASGLYEAVRYVLSHRSIVPTDGAGARENRHGEDMAFENEMSVNGPVGKVGGPAEEESRSSAKTEEKPVRDLEEDDGPIANIDVDVEEGLLEFDSSSKRVRKIQQRDVKKRRPVVGDGSSGIRSDWLSVDNVINALLVLAGLSFTAVLVLEVAIRRRSEVGSQHQGDKPSSDRNERPVRQ